MCLPYWKICLCVSLLENDIVELKTESLDFPMHQIVYAALPDYSEPSLRSLMHDEQNSCICYKVQRIFLLGKIGRKT